MASDDYEIAGYLPFGETHSEGYVNTEGRELDNMDFLEEAQFVVVHELESDSYFTVIGPFDDYDDLEAQADALFDEEDY